MSIASEHAVEEPLLSSRLVLRSLMVVSALAAATLALSMSSHWLGQTVRLAGNSESRRELEIAIGDDRLRIPENTIRFSGQRQAGTAERLDLTLTWPGLEGYGPTTRPLFDNARQAQGLIFVQLNQATMSRDMSGRLLPVYSRLTEGPVSDHGFGLKRQNLREGAGYLGEVLLTAPLPDGTSYVVRCTLPAQPDNASSADCQRDIRIGKDLSLLYRFSSLDLRDWQKIDADLRRFFEARLRDPAASIR